MKIEPGTWEKLSESVWLVWANFDLVTTQTDLRSHQPNIPSASFRFSEVVAVKQEIFLWSPAPTSQTTGFINPLTS